MKTLQITITDMQRSNLLQFLKRCDLKGSEVEAFVEIISVINEATPLKDDKESETS